MGKTNLTRKRKLAILLRDNLTCLYCKEVYGLDNLTVDHLHPICLGGTDRDRNVVASCYLCNQYKGNTSWSRFPVKEEVERRRKRPTPTYLNIINAMVTLHGYDGTVERLNELAHRIRSRGIWK